MNKVIPNTIQRKQLIEAGYTYKTCDILNITKEAATLLDLATNKQITFYFN